MIRRPMAIPRATWHSLLLIASLCGHPGDVEADDLHPLRPADTSSPRSTLFGFIGAWEDRYAGLLGPDGFVTRYRKSGALFPPPGDFERGMQQMVRFRALSARFLDLSALPQAYAMQAAWRTTVQLEEVLDKLSLPVPESVPDTAQMASTGYKQWTLPETEIRIALVETGSRGGEYLFSRETIRRIPEFFARVQGLPSRNGHTEDMYDFVFHTPSGVAIALHWVVPPRWLYELPEWTRVLIMDQPLWRWVFMVTVLGLSACLFLLALKLTSRLSGKWRRLARFPDLLPPASLLIVVPAAAFILDEVLRVSPNIMTALGLALWALFYLALTWLVWTAGRVIGEWLIGVQRIRTGDIDRQLIRLATRLLSLILSIAILIEGANRLGLPAYSVLAGLGIGGLAAALAGQQTLANLFGSLIIMIEKPFRIGHKIRTSNLEGFVEDVGFRSTRLRTPDHTLVTVPSSDLINHTIENLSQRRYWRVFERLHLVTDVPTGRLQSFVAAVWAKVFHRADVARDDFRVLLSGIGLHGYEVILDFSIHARTETRFLRKRHVLLLRIAAIAESHGVRFERDNAGTAAANARI